MNLLEAVSATRSKQNCDAIVKWIGNSQQRFNDLFSLFLTGGYRVTQTASWPLIYCLKNHPHLMHANYKQLLLHLKKPGLHDSVKRNAVRLLQFVEIPRAYQGEIMNVCFQYLEDPAEAVAIKAFSLTVLSNLAKQYPEIIPEITILVKDQLPHQTAAFKVRAKAFLKKVEK